MFNVLAWTSHPTWFQSVAVLSAELAQQGSHYILYSDTREQFLGEGLSGFQFVGRERKKEVVGIHDVVILANNTISQICYELYVF